MASKQEDSIPSLEEEVDSKEMEEDDTKDLKQEKCMPFKLWKFIVTGIAGTTLDVATHIYECYKHFR